MAEMPINEKMSDLAKQNPEWFWFNMVTATFEQRAHHPSQALYIRADLVDDLREALVTFLDYGCPVCQGDCSAANPPIIGCPMQQAQAAIVRIDALKEK